MEVLVGRYELVRRLGEGGMGEVHEALDRQTKRRVAVKRMRPGRALPPDVVARFSREILATAQITSKHVVAVHDAGVDDGGAPFLVMDYLEGEDLGALADRLGALPVAVALRLAAQVCDGLIAAHAADIVHRDIKPSNLFLCAPVAGGARIVKIVDFGVARVRSAEQGVTELTQTGAIVGSPLYMAPEQLRGEKSLDHRADVWSLGVVTYRLLCGAVPHAGNTLADVLVAVCSEPAPPIRERAPWVPAEIAACVHQALAIDPYARIASARALRDQLRRWVPDPTVTDDMLVTEHGPPPGVVPEPVRVTTPGAAAAALSSTQVAPPEPAPAPAPAPPKPAPPRPAPAAPRNTRVATIVLALVLVAAAILAVGFVRHRQDDKGTESGEALLADMPPELRDTKGAAWFVEVHGRCSALELRQLLADTPPPKTRDGTAFAIACAAAAGDLDLAHQKLMAVSSDQRAYAAGAMFELAHEMADRRNNDPNVAKIMRLVIEVWPNNYQALYAAGVVEFQQAADPKQTRQHLLDFLVTYDREDGFSATARAILDQLDHKDCKRKIVDPMGKPIAIPKCH